VRRRWYVVVFGTVEAVLALLDALFGSDVVLSTTYVVPVLVLALVATPTLVAGAGCVAVLLSILSGLEHDTLDTSRQLVRMLLVGGGSSVAVAFSVARTRLGTELRRQQQLAAENERLVTALHARERELTAVVDGIADAVLVHDAAGRPKYANERAAEILAMPDAAAVLAAEPGAIPAGFRFFDPAGEPLGPERFPGRRIFQGDPDPPDLLARNVNRATGLERWTVTKATAVPGPDGKPVLAVNVIEDVTEARRREEATELLAEAGQVLGSSLDLQSTLDRVASLAVPRLADWCSVDLPDGPNIRTAAVAHTDPGLREAGELLLERHPSRMDDDYGVAAVLRGEGSVVRADVSHEQLQRYAQDERHLAELEVLGITHLAIVGMDTAGQTIGSLTLVRGAARPAFTPEEVQLAEELARRAGTAVLNASLYEERVLVADTLQRSLLPPELPSPDGLQMASHYRAVGRAGEVGGDFYDAFPLPDGWLVAIGDVTGKGAEAAALTGLARAAFEAVTTLTGRPGLALEHLHGLLARRGDMALATVGALHFHAGEDPPRATVFCAGHPPTLLIRDGAVTALTASGPILGAFVGQQWLEAEVTLREGDVLLLRTDGVTDSVGDEGRLGEERLQAALEGSPAGDAQAAVDRVRSLVEAHQAGAARDDIAIIAVAVTGPVIALPPAQDGLAMPSLSRAVTLEATPASVGQARALITRTLDGLLAPAVIDDVRLLVSELASNAVRHAGGGDYRLELDLDPHRLRVELSDGGPGPVAGGAGRIRDALPEGGYGLGIVDRLSVRWGIERGSGPRPTRIWFELPRDERH
jgi:serine phosphatase RsbU (regulator of sigma subunit)/anti-sigma regulatory factor (Ser/Thr protein kinase)